MFHLSTRNVGSGFLNSRKPYKSIVTQLDTTGLADDASGVGELSDLRPRALKTNSSKIGGFLFDTLGIIAAIVILVFAVIGYSADQNVISEKERRVLEVSRVLSTAFPYIFALILGRALQSALAWRLEKGVDCLSFAYLSRSLTLGGAFTVPLHLRCVHWVPPILLIIWAFSPLGSQALLRFTSVQVRPMAPGTLTGFQYAYPGATYASICAACQVEAHNAVTMASFLSIETTGGRSQDAWGNIKIPMVDDNLETDPQGWVQLSEISKPQYTSLIGIPSEPFAVYMNTTFIMQSWYWQLENPSLWKNGTLGPLLTSSEKYAGSDKLSNYTSTNRLWQFALPERLNVTTTSSIPLTFEVTKVGVNINNSVTYKYGTNGPVDDLYYAIRLEASLTQKPVELNVSCVSTNCKVTAIRKVTMEASYNTELDRDYFNTRFLSHLSAAFPREHSGTESENVLQAYLFNPSKNPYASIKLPDSLYLTDFDAPTLARRLSQVINTHWIADNYFSNAAGSFDTDEVSGFLKGRVIRDTNLFQIDNLHVLRCDRTWFAILCISTLVMLAAAAAAPVLRSLCMANDTTDFLSAMILHNGGEIASGRTYLNANERARLIRNVRLKVGDGQPDDAVGKVIIGQEAHVSSFRSGRSYM
ncbi:hypothetical protein VTL71DRAFT_6545 [Oculimacula yallundae]|uniref:Uncharacterized protein n=1 Tax=Oculimacula yallundae TaxID=86028 RepID=A0ABR4BX83_9HELO